MTTKQKISVAVYDSTWSNNSEPLPPTPYSDDSLDQSIDSALMTTGGMDPLSARAQAASPPSSDTTIVDMQLDRILSRLSSMEIVAKLARRWWQINLCGPFPRSIFDRILQSVESTAQRLGSSQAQCRTLTVAIRESTLKPWSITSDATPGRHIQSTR